MQPTELKFFPHWPADGATPEGCSGTLHMDLEDKKGDTTCSTSTQVAQEVFSATGQELISYTYPANAGVPFVVDASRKLTGEITIRGTFTIQGYVEVLLTGVVAGQEVEIASGSTSPGNGLLSNSAQGVELPGPPATLPVEIEINKAVDKQEVSALTLQLTVRGFHRGHIDFERNPSYLVPALTA